MKPSREESLIEVWRQALVENAKVVMLGTERYPVRLTPKRGLRQVDFVFEGSETRGPEQNLETKSRWAQMARSGKKVMQFLSEGRYVANVVDGKVTRYYAIKWISAAQKFRWRKRGPVARQLENVHLMRRRKAGEFAKQYSDVTLKPNWQ